MNHNSPADYYTETAAAGMTAASIIENSAAKPKAAADTTIEAATNNNNNNNKHSPGQGKNEKDDELLVEKLRREVAELKRSVRSHEEPIAGWKRGGANSKKGERIAEMQCSGVIEEISVAAIAGRKLDWNTVPEPWKSDRRVAQAAIGAHYVKSWNELPLDLRNDIEFARSNLHQFPDTIFAHSALFRSDRALWVKFLRGHSFINYGERRAVLENHAPIEIRSDRQLMLSACIEKADIFELLDESLATNQDFLLELVGREPLSLEHVPDALKVEFPNVVDRAIQKYQEVDYEIISWIRFAKRCFGSDLWNDRTFLLSWFQNGGPFLVCILLHRGSPGTLERAMPAYRSDEEIFILIAKHCRAPLLHTSFWQASMELRGSKKFMLRALGAEPVLSLLRQAAPELQDDFDLNFAVFSGKESAAQDEVRRRGEHAQYLRIFRSTLLTRLSEHNSVATCVLLSDLNQGKETSKALINGILEFLDAPTFGEELDMHRRALRNLNAATGVFLDDPSLIDCAANARNAASTSHSKFTENCDFAKGGEGVGYGNTNSKGGKGVSRGWGNKNVLKPDSSSETINKPRERKRNFFAKPPVGQPKKPATHVEPAKKCAPPDKKPAPRIEPARNCALVKPSRFATFFANVSRASMKRATLPSKKQAPPVAKPPVKQAKQQVKKHDEDELCARRYVRVPVLLVLVSKLAKRLSFWLLLLCCGDRSSSLSWNGAAAAFANDNNSNISFDQLQGRRILVVGGSGRVGGSVTTQLIRHGVDQIVVAGTSPDRFVAARQRWMRLFPERADAIQKQIVFCTVDRERADSVKDILLNNNNNNKFDLVVHTAGPFQGRVNAPNGVLQACLDVSVPYIDVCDDYCTATAARTQFAEQAEAAGVPCVLSTGCWPGVSSLMAKQLVSAALESNPQLQRKDLKVRFSFFTAGSGGAGVTLLVATFLILAERALKVVNGRRTSVQPMQDYSTVHFGDIVGNKDVAPLNLLETASAHDILGVGSVESLFGTAPDFWNTLLGLMAKLPPDVLANEPLMRRLSVFSIPIVRAVDALAGATNAMRCDVTTSDNAEPALTATALYAHDNLELCVGECVAAFCCAVLSDGAVPPGVWFPEQAVAAGVDAAAVLALASVGAHTTEVSSTSSSEGDAGIQQLLTRDKVWGTRQSISDSPVARGNS